MITVIVKKNAYFDSITLMKLSQEVRKIKAVQEVQVAMGTAHNKSLLKDSNLWSNEAEIASDNDLCIAFSSENDDCKEEVLKTIEQSLYGDKSQNTQSVISPKTISEAISINSDINLVLISVPGQYAAFEAKNALEKNLNVMMFSDNVTLEDERELKEIATKKDLLMMGPDCGTAIINSVGLGFANKVRSGKVGIVGASGTGIQEVSVLLDRLGLGISQAFGTGGRDLKKQIGALMMKQGLKILEKDEQTEIIGIISKPPDFEVAKEILQQVKKINKPVVICFLGLKEQPEIEGKNIVFANNLTQAAIEIANIAKISTDMLNKWQAPNISFASSQNKIYGLFCGGTLCSEAQNIIGSKHLCIDFGSDEYTKGKPHPMIDPSTRNQAFIDFSKKEDTAILLFDIVLGYGSHEDPAANLLPIINKIKEDKNIVFIASVCGCEDDLQCYSKQVKQLESAGVIVAQSNAIAAQIANSLIHK